MPSGGAARGVPDHRLQRRDDRAHRAPSRRARPRHLRRQRRKTSCRCRSARTCRTMRDWVPRHFDFAGYIIGEHPETFGSRAELRAGSATAPDERVCIVTVGGSGVGAHLIRRILQSYADGQRARLPELRMIVVAGPRIDPRSLNAPRWRRGARLRARSRPPSRRLRSGAGAGRPHHLHGADGGRHAVPLSSRCAITSSRTSTSPIASTATAPAGAWTSPRRRRT